MTDQDFTAVRTGEMYESPAHEDNGVSIGNAAVYRLSAELSAELTDARPAEHAFQSNCGYNKSWFFRFETATQSAPEQVNFKRGLKSDRWYAEALFF